MAPLTRSRSQQPGDIPWALNAEYYRQRASAGLIISEATQISPQGKGYAFTPGMYTPEQRDGWRLVTGAVHAAGGRIIAQLWHVGRISHTSLQPGNQPPVAPSAIRAEKSRTYIDGTMTRVECSIPRALETHEVYATINDYRHAARIARDAGFDGVQLHAANSYLVDQFLRTSTNHRTDEFGGSLRNRLRFAQLATQALIEEWGSGRVSVRLNPTNYPPSMVDDNPAETFSALAQSLSEMNIAFLEVMEPFAWREGETVAGPEVADATRRAFKGPIVINGGYTPARARHAVESRHADAVSLGRLFIANPDLVARIATSAPLNSPDPTTYYSGTEKGYTDYPTLSAQG
jgi:N-ethylmaleimide reductase